MVLNNPPSLTERSLTVNVTVYVITPPTVRVVELEPAVALTNAGLPSKLIRLPLEEVIVSIKTKSSILSFEVFVIVILKTTLSPIIPSLFPSSTILNVLITSKAGTTPVYEIVLSFSVFPSSSSPSSL